MKFYILIPLLFVLSTFKTIAQVYPDSTETTDSSSEMSEQEMEHKVLFDRIVQYKMLEKSYPGVLFYNDDILEMMMLFSDDGFFGFSESRYLTIESRFYNLIQFRDLDGNFAELQKGNDGNYQFYGSYGNNISTFKKGALNFVIKNETGNYYDLTYNWINLKKIESEDGYVITLKRSKKGLIIADNLNNSVIIKNNGSKKKIATYSTGEVLESQNGFMNFSGKVLKDNIPILDVKLNMLGDNVEVKDQYGVNITIRKDDRNSNLDPFRPYPTNTPRN